MVNKYMIFMAFLMLLGCQDSRTVVPQKTGELQVGIHRNDKCIALLAYGLISEEDEDVPLGGGCKDFMPDSLIDILIEQKRVYNKWKKIGVVDSVGIRNGKRITGDLRLLSDLINNRIQVEKSRGKGKGWEINAYAIHDKYGKDYGFIWRNIILGLTLQNSIEPIDSLLNIKTFIDFSQHLDALLSPTSQWCREVTNAVTEYKKYSREDYFLEYYFKRCESPSQRQITHP